MGILEAVRKMREKRMDSGFRFDRPLVLLQSDDWGRVGVHDEEGREELRSAGLEIGERAYDLYSLETAEDVGALAEMLGSLADSASQSPCLEMNFVTANVDFAASVVENPGHIVLKSLVEGLPGRWSRTGLYEAYRDGIKSCVFAPSLHAATHFCQQAALETLAEDGERGDLLRKLWRAETPYIYWRMPWVGYEYWNPNREAEDRFLSENEQQRWIAFAAEAFERFFGQRALSACAPGYRANQTTAQAWKKQGIRIAQNGPGAGSGPHFDEHGLLRTYRSVDFEPALNAELRSEDCLASARDCFAAGQPFIMSVHSLNFHSTLAPFRQRTLPLLKELLQALAENFPDVLYVNSQQLLEIIESGGYETAGGRIQIAVRGTGKGAGA